MQPAINPPNDAVTYPLRFLTSSLLSTTFLCIFVVSIPAITNKDMKNNENEAIKANVIIGLTMIITNPTL